jgi:hypothetical protein
MGACMSSQHQIFINVIGVRLFTAGMIEWDKQTVIVLKVNLFFALLKYLHILRFIVDLMQFSKRFYIMIIQIILYY